MAVPIGNVWTVSAWSDGVWAAGVWQDSQAPAPGGGGSMIVSSAGIIRSPVFFPSSTTGIVHAPTYST